jgi:hypothetical protein
MSDKSRLEREKNASLATSNPRSADLSDDEVDILAKHFETKAAEGGEKFGGGANGLLSKRAKYFRKELYNRRKKGDPNPDNKIKM